MSYSAGGEPSRSGTTIVAMRDHHDVKIHGYSRTLNAHGARPRFRLRPFRAGGHTWHVSYRPMGSSHSPDNTDSVSLYLVLDDVVEEAVMAQACFSLLDRDGAPVDDYTFTTRKNNFSESRDRAFGYERFIRREDLERSGYLNDDCFAVRVQVFIVREVPAIAVPPPDMRRHIGDLLSSKEEADVKFQVGGETFEAHRLVLGARSPVFMAELLGPMKEGVAAAASAAIRIDDIEPRVFEAMLTFIYTDAWPEAQMEEEDACVMAQHLLVAADRYRLERLKSMCEERLRSNHIDTGSAATILALAEQHCCADLKEACFEFLGAPAALLAVMETKEFEYLGQSCPGVMKELISVILSRDLEKVKVSRAVACNLEDDATKVEEGVVDEDFRKAKDFERSRKDTN